jgi:ribosome-associated toxin RatA of RatAB toxin-antitoxin module
LVRLLQGNYKNIARTALLVGWCGVALSSAAWSKELSDAETLSKGQVVVKQNAPATPKEVPSVEAQILISRPPAKVWTVVIDPEKLMQEEPKVRKAKVISRSPGKQNVAFSVVMAPLLPAFNYVLVQELSPPNLLRFHRLSGSFRDIQGSWRLLPAENGAKTILSYTLKLDPGPFIPKSMLLTAVKSDLPNMMRLVKASIDKNTL